MLTACLPDYPDDSPFWATYQEADDTTGSVNIPDGYRLAFRVHKETDVRDGC